jgi:hypothetical protein
MISCNETTYSVNVDEVRAFRESTVAPAMRQSFVSDVMNDLKMLGLLKNKQREEMLIDVLNNRIREYLK